MFNILASNFISTMVNLTGFKLASISYNDLSDEKVVSFSPKTTGEDIITVYLTEVFNGVTISVDAINPNKDEFGTSRELFNTTYKKEELGNISTTLQTITNRLGLLNPNGNLSSCDVVQFVLQAIGSGKFKRFSSLVIIRTPRDGELEELEYTKSRGHKYANIKVSGNKFLVNGKPLEHYSTVLEEL